MNNNSIHVMFNSQRRKERKQTVSESIQINLSPMPPKSDTSPPVILMLQLLWTILNQNLRAGLKTLRQDSSYKTKSSPLGSFQLFGCFSCFFLSNTTFVCFFCFYDEQSRMKERCAAVPWWTQMTETCIFKKGFVSSDCIVGVITHYTSLTFANLGICTAPEKRKRLPSKPIIK